MRHRTINLIEAESGWIAYDPFVGYSLVNEKDIISAVTNAAELANAWYLIQDKGSFDKEDEVEVWYLDNSHAVCGFVTSSTDILIQHLTEVFPIESELLTIRKALAWVGVAVNLEPGENVTFGSWTITVPNETWRLKDFKGDFSGWVLKENLDQLASSTKKVRGGGTSRN